MKFLLKSGTAYVKHFMVLLRSALTGLLLVRLALACLQPLKVSYHVGHHVHFSSPRGVL